MVKEEMSNNVHHVVEGGHGFNPLSEIMDRHNDALVAPTIWGIASHGVNAPLVEGIGNDDWV
jgi:hypothetical protein